MTLKYPKKSGPKRKEKLGAATVPQYHESAHPANTWTGAHPQQQQQQQPLHQQQLQSPTEAYTLHHDYVDASQYSPEYYSSAYNNSTRHHLNGTKQQQLSPVTNHHHLIESCDWSAATNHEATKPVALTYTTSNGSQDENNNSHSVAAAPQWTTEFSYIDAKAEPQLCSPNNGGGSLHHQQQEILPEYINYNEYDLQTGFPPSISSNCSTLSSPTTSSDYNFNYQFDPLNSSISNDGFDAMYQQQSQPQLVDSYVSYEVPMETGIYATEGLYSSVPEVSETTHWATDVSNIAYEQNYYPFANCTEKMMVF